MISTKSDAAPEPPVPSYFLFVSAELVPFMRALFGRFIAYGVVLGHIISGIIGQVLTLGVRVKKYMIRLLMFRGGIFYHTPRLGLTAIVSTAAFSLFVFPAVQPMSESRAISAVLAKQPSLIGSSTVLAATQTTLATKSGKSIRSEVIDHQVASGETLSSIAELYLVSVEGLKFVNNLNDDMLHPGDTLSIPPVNGLIHKVVEGDTISSLATLYNVPQQAIADFNALEDPFILHGGDELIIPDAQIPVKKVVPVQTYYAATQPSTGLTLQTTAVTPLGTGGFVMPTSAVLSQYFWWGHTAIDLAGSCGTPIVASDSGTITFAGWWNGGGGNSIWVDHGNGYVTQYAHMSGFERTGGTVARGEVIGYIGTTGRSTGCHLHFMVLRNGIPIDPLGVL